MHKIVEKICFVGAENYLALFICNLEHLSRVYHCTILEIAIWFLKYCIFIHLAISKERLAKNI